MSAREPHRFLGEPLRAATGGERFAGAVSAEMLYPGRRALRIDPMQVLKGE